MTENEITRMKLVLGMQFKSWQDAESSFLETMVKCYDAGMTKRDIAIGIGLRPMDVETILDQYAPGIRQIQRIRERTVK